MFEFKNRRLNDWWDFGVELGRLNQQEAAMLKLLETQKGSELTRVQRSLNEIAALKAKIIQTEKDFNAD